MFLSVLCKLNIQILMWSVGIKTYHLEGLTVVVHIDEFYLIGLIKMLKKFQHLFKN